MVDNICPTESKNVNIRDKINSESEFFLQGQFPTLTNTVLTGSTCGKALGKNFNVRLKQMNISIMWYAYGTLLC